MASLHYIAQATFLTPEGDCPCKTHVDICVPLSGARVTSLFNVR